MKNLIISAFAEMEKKVGTTKKVVESLSIMDVKPSEFSKFMEENAVPDTAWFIGSLKSLLRVTIKLGCSLTLLGYPHIRG